MHTLPRLNYDYDALGKYISKEIMELHHSKHHQAYIDKLNAALDAEPQLKEQSLESLLSNIETLPESVKVAIRNNGGGHYNHTLFWQWMTPNGGHEPNGGLAESIVAKYGSFQHFVDDFSAKALGVFGSGWVWLLPDMSIVTTANQDTPINTSLNEPLLGLDVWEHAYYLDYRNRRADYIKAWWNVVNWEFVQERFQKRIVE